MSITEHTVKTRRHTTYYLATGPENGPLVIFVHGWPELSISWRHQLPALAALGFRTIAPDMRGYGRSSVPVLFLNARYDYVCECIHSRLPEPMRVYCRNLTEETIRSGHWLAQEKPVEVNAALVKWLATAVPDVWPKQK
jgi:pimeloyl-ACP methyl ester carboxylesterase